jgi:hypothetical protein
MSSRHIATLVACTILTACSGTVVMTPAPPDQLKADYEQGRERPGIIVYRAVPIVEVDKFSQVNLANPSKPDGPPLLSGACNEKLVRKIITIADTRHPYRLRYDHGLLEAYTFGATLTGDGVLASINSQSTPDQGRTLQNLASAAATAGGPFRLLSAGPGTTRPDCTITPVFVGYENPPDETNIKKFGETQLGDEH